MTCRLFIFSFLLFSIVVKSPIYAATGEDIYNAFELINKPTIDEKNVYSVKNLTLESAALKLHLDSGVFYFFRPLQIDSGEIVPGGYFAGFGRFEFRPAVQMEREQLQRFYNSDSLNRIFYEAELFFSDNYAQILNKLPPTDLAAKPNDINNKIKKLHEHITKDDYKYYDFKTLKNLTENRQQPFFTVNTVLEKDLPTLYRYDPTEREEVSLSKEYWDPRGQFMELICSYDESSSDDSLNLNGDKKEEINCRHFDITASIDRKGKFYGATELSFEALRSGTRMINLTLHPELFVDEVTDSAGNVLKRICSEEGEKQQYGLYVIFDKPLTAGETHKISFSYSGDIAERILGEFFVTAGALWYPRYGHSQRTTFDISFKTPKEFDFTSSGNKISEEIIGDTLVTNWQLDVPSRNVSFNIGNMKKYEFTEENIPSVEVHFSKDLHGQIASYEAREGEMVRHGKDMEKQVAQDVQNSLKLFAHHFGATPHERIIVTEVLQYHYGEAFAGFLHLGYKTWENTDYWGEDRMLRSHEVAHQWWGAGVGYETYHDQWLSEGFAEYSSLIYLQAVSGTDKFFEKIRKYRDDIYSVRKFLLSSGNESGPIALGYRTQSTETRGDYGLVIYKKGALVLHMLRNILIELKTLNEDLFFEMMTEYYETHHGQNASTRDFQNLVELYTGMDMTWFFDQWVYGTELPEYEFKYDLQKGDDGYYYANCRITQANVTDGFKMFMPVEIDFGTGKAYIRLLVDKPLYEFKLPPLAEKPKKITLNPFESVLAKIKQ